MATVDLKAVISADDRATPVLNRFGSSVGDIAKGVALGQLAFSGLRQATDFLTGSIKGSIAAFSEAQDVSLQLDAVLRSTKGAAGLAKEELLQLSRTLQAQTTYSDEAVLSAENMLLTFTKIGKDVFPQATETVLNMSTALGQDAKNSAIQLGKALNDPIEGVTALRRVGVTFTEQQREQIKTLVESGRTLEAQKLILAELSTEFGGSAAAAAQGYSGHIKQLRNDVNDMQEKIGEAIIKGIDPFVQRLKAFVNSPEGKRFADQLTESITRFFNYLADHQNQIIEIFKGIGKAVEIVLAPIKAYVELLKEVYRLTGTVTNKIFDIKENISGKIGNAKDFFSNLFKAEGGPVTGGKPYIVGERGPEVFVPSGSGSIIPNKGLAGGNITINMENVHINSDMDVRDLGLQLAKQIQMITQGA